MVHGKGMYPLILVFGALLTSSQGNYSKAFGSMKRLRSMEIQASRDMYYAYKLLEVERAEREGRNLFKEFFTVRRNRRAAASSFFVMFMQQFCGVNVIGTVPSPRSRITSANNFSKAYYSTQIFKEAGFSEPQALLVSLGTGVVNFLFAIPGKQSLSLATLRICRAI